MGFYHNERPSIFRYQQSFSYLNSQLDLYLEVDKKEVVSGLYYQWSGPSYFEEEFSEYAKKVEGLNLKDVAMPAGKGWSYAYFFYRQFILQITGAELPISIQKGKDPYGLICRCMAIYEDDIRSHIQAQLDSENYDYHSVYKTIGDELMATIGCGSCKHDVESILSEYIKGDRGSLEESPVVEQAQIPRWQSLDSQTLARESFTLLKSLSVQIKSELKLLGTKPGSILIKANEDLSSEQVESLEVAFADALGAGLDLQIK